MDGSTSSETTEEAAAEGTCVDSCLRRRVLLGVAATGAMASAGCLGGGEDGDTTDDPEETDAPEETEMPANGEQTTAGNGMETTTDSGGQTYDIEYVVQEATVGVGSTETLLDAGLDEGLEMPYQCEVGVCGECAATVDGDGTELVEHDGAEAIDEAQMADGYVLPCVAQPRAEFSLTTGKADEI